MLPAEHRLRRSNEFGRTVRTGKRSGRSTVVAHVAVQHDSARATAVGLVVSKAVGNAVTRNLVKRRVRSIMRDEVTLLPGGLTVVIRALPAAATSSYDALRKDVLGAVRKANTLATAPARGTQGER